MPFKKYLPIPLQNLGDKMNAESLRNHLTLKLISIFMALFVWFLSKKGQEPIKVNFSAPIIFKNFPEKLQISSEFPSLVNLTGMLQGRSSKTFHPKDVQIIIDMKNVKPGRFSHTINESNIDGISNIQIMSMSPTKLEIDLAEVTTKFVTLTPRYHGRLKDGYILKKIEIIPNQVEVQGIESKTNQLAQVFTKSIDLESRSESFEESITLDLPNNIQNISQNQFVAKVQIKVLPVRRVFKDVPIVIIGTTYESKINPEAFNLHLEGPANILDLLGQKGITAEITAKDREPGSYWVRPTVKLPEGVSVLQQWPPISLWIKTQRIN